MLTVQTIVNIAAQAEKVFDHRYHFDLLMEQSLYVGADMGASPAGVRVGHSSSELRCPKAGQEASLTCRRACRGMLTVWSVAVLNGHQISHNANQTHPSDNRDDINLIRYFNSAESAMDLSSMDGMSMTRRNTGSSNNMARNVSTRSLGLASAPGSSLSKLESIASTAVRAADKVRVRTGSPLRQEHTTCTVAKRCENLPHVQECPVHRACKSSSMSTVAEVRHSNPV